MMSYIKAEGRKKKRMLQMRNVKFKLLQKLLEQAGLIKDLHLQNGEPETDEERGKRLQQDLKAAHERNRRLSQQLDFWGTRIDQRKDQLDEEKKHLRKEFGRNWESKLERALLGHTEEDPESEATSETSESEEENNTHGERGTAGQQPESKQPGEESVRLVPGKRNQVVGKTYSKERPRVRRRAPDEREHPREPREELPGTLQRKPLASFGAARGEDMEDVVLQGRRQSYSSRRSSQTSDDSNSRVSEDLDPHDRGSLADHIVKVMGNAPKSQSYLEGLNRLRPSAQYYTYGKRREVPGQKKRSKRRVSIRSFVEDLSDDGTDRERPRRPSTASVLPEGFDARGRTLRGNSRLSRASVESRSAFSDGDQGELQQLVQEAAEEEHKGVNAAEWLQKALALRQESRKRSKGSTLAAPVHLETVRLLRTAAKMSMKRQVAADDLLGANLLRAQHMNVTSAGQKSKQIFQADAAFREMAERRKVEAEAWTQRLASGTARSRYAATKAKLLAMEGLETRRPPLPKKEALRRLFRAKTTSPAQSEAFIRSRSRSRAKSRSKQVLDNFENALGKARNSDAHREIARMKVMSLHHSAMRRRFLQNYSSEEEEEDEVVHRRSIMMLAEDESPNRPGRKGLIGASPERAVSKPLQGLTTALNEGVQDEKVAEVAAKWLGERPYDDRESMIVDASAHVEQTEAPALASFGAFRPSRRMKARTMGPRSQSRRRSEEGSSSGSEDSYPSTSRRTDRSNASPDGDENVHFRNVAYFIDLMNENDSHKHRKRKSSRRRRKALRQQRMQASRADVRWHSHMLKLLELRLGTSRPQASGHVSDESPSDCDSSRSPARRHGPPPLPRKLAARARTAPNTQVEAPRAESPKPPAKTGGTENSSLKTMARDDGLRQSVERTQACPKSVQMKLEEGGWSRLKSPALPQAQDAHRPLQGTQPSPWWGRRHDTRQARFAASTARVNFNDTDADAKERRGIAYCEVGENLGLGKTEQFAEALRALCFGASCSWRMAWFWEGRGRYNAYDEKINEYIEMAYQQYQSGVTSGVQVVLPQGSYFISFPAMRQMRVDGSMRTRQVQRASAPPTKEAEPEKTKKEAEPKETGDTEKTEEKTKPFVRQKQRGEIKDCRGMSGPKGPGTPQGGRFNAYEESVSNYLESAYQRFLKGGEAGLAIELISGRYFISFPKMLQMSVRDELGAKSEAEEAHERTRRVRREGGEDELGAKSEAEEAEAEGRKQRDAAGAEVLPPPEEPSEHDTSPVSCPKVVWLGNTVSYHMTSKTAAERILRSQRFRPSQQGMLGPFIYFASSAEDCEGKARQALMEGVILRAVVSMGQCLLVDAPPSEDASRILGIKSWREMTQQKLRQLGCSSIYAKSPLANRDEWAVPSANQVLEVACVGFKKRESRGMKALPLWKWPGWAHSVPVGNYDTAIEYASVKQIVSTRGVQVDSQGRPVDNDGRHLSFADAQKRGWAGHPDSLKTRSSSAQQTAKSASFPQRAAEKTNPFLGIQRDMCSSCCSSSGSLGRQRSACHRNCEEIVFHLNHAFNCGFLKPGAKWPAGRRCL
ncbi:unnamed protein product [Effrenium voratum]|nr:unnamed protein product [Effrenium voratum]